MKTHDGEGNSWWNSEQRVTIYNPGQKSLGPRAKTRAKLDICEKRLAYVCFSSYITLLWSLPSPLFPKAMLKAPAMILGVKGASNQHCIAVEGESENLRSFCESVPRLLARIVGTRGMTQENTGAVCSLACVGSVRGKMLAAERKYRQRSREENGKVPLFRGIGGSAAIASRWRRARDDIPPATQAIFNRVLKLSVKTKVITTDASFPKNNSELKWH